MASETLVRDATVTGAWVQPRNRWQAGENSIHNDAVARKVGMRGGTIPGTVHLSHFAPILTELFGERWLKDGVISMYYTFATLDGEDVRAVVERPAAGAGGDIQLKAWVETPERREVCTGTVSVGRPEATPYVRGLPLKAAAPSEVRILEAMKAGLQLIDDPAFVVAADAADSEGIVRDPQQMYRAMQPYAPGVTVKDAVGFFGATEVALRAGPIRAGVPYRKTARVVSIGASPKTEFAWFDSELTDADGRLVAEMRHMTRWMKVSSPKWAS
jgi:hypothetical protein